MRISDWSSDVCSSDLREPMAGGGEQREDLFLRMPFTHPFTERATLDKLHDHEHPPVDLADVVDRSEEHTSELQSLMRISYAVFCLKKKKKKQLTAVTRHTQIHKTDKH